MVLLLRAGDEPVKDLPSEQLRLEQTNKVFKAATAVVVIIPARAACTIAIVPSITVVVSQNHLF